MPSKTDEKYLIPFLQRALDSEIGVELTFLDTESARLVRQKIYALRKVHVEYASLALVIKGERLWLIKQREGHV